MAIQHILLVFVKSHIASIIINIYKTLMIDYSSCIKKSGNVLRGMQPN